MAVFKCKMCGGALEINAGDSVAVCEYCNTKQTLPKLNDDKRAQLYDRANYFRRENEFDKATGVYEMILSEDKEECESYWGIVLCRYGIEYVEDPRSHKRIPTVNRAQFTSIFEDADYKNAIKYADALQKEVYEAEATVIDNIQKGILAISQKEEPFDVFICYKETDSLGNRTQDSVYAQDIYTALTKEGHKVFFSRITLEDKLGSAYEPYIFAALNSTKVMLVVGTSKENFEAVWVKNEWSRFVSLIESGKEKTLIPVYKDMSPYEMPEEFQYLQSQDMGKIGFMQDLVRGVTKLVGADKPVIKETIVVNQGNAQTEPLLKRVFMFLEDGDFARADEFCEQILNIDPENVQAYLGKLMVECNVRKFADLENCEKSFEHSANYQKVLRFGEDKLKLSLAGYLKSVKENIELKRINGIYQQATITMSSAATIERYEEAIDEFKKILGYKDSLQLTKQCQEQIDKMKAEQAAKKEQERLERERKEKEIKEKEARFLKYKKVFLCIIGFCFLVMIVLTQISNKVVPHIKYTKAFELMNAGEYIEAISMFEKLNGYKDSANKIDENKELVRESTYNAALELMNSGKYSESYSLFQELNGYKDSGEKLMECSNELRYSEGIALMNAGKYVEAYKELIALDGYKDSREKALSIFEKYKVEIIKTAKVGDEIFFGTYEQDNDIFNGKENIEWLVLKVEDEKALLISKYALDCMSYNKTEDSVTWETCTLRSWLNSDFINQAFSENEKTKLVTVSLPAGKNSEYDTNPGNSTQDKTFLLSTTEAGDLDWFDRECTATEYAISKDTSEYSEYCFWWLRTPGCDSTNAAVVDYNGIIREIGRSVDVTFVSVRPAMWISIE